MSFHEVKEKLPGYGCNLVWLLREGIMTDGITPVDNHIYNTIWLNMTIVVLK